MQNAESLLSNFYSPDWCGARGDGNLENILVLSGTRADSLSKPMQEAVWAPKAPVSSDVSQEPMCSSWLAVTEKWIEPENTDLQEIFIAYHRMLIIGGRLRLSRKRLPVVKTCEYQ